MRPVKSSVRSPKGDLSPERELATDHLTADIGQRSRRGGAVLMAAQAVRVVGQMATLVVLARLLPPAQLQLDALMAALRATPGLIAEPAPAVPTELTA